MGMSFGAEKMRLNRFAYFSYLDREVEGQKQIDSPAPPSVRWASCTRPDSLCVSHVCPPRVKHVAEHKDCIRLELFGDGPRLFEVCVDDKLDDGRLERTPPERGRRKVNQLRLRDSSERWWDRSFALGRSSRRPFLPELLCPPPI